MQLLIRLSTWAVMALVYLGLCAGRVYAQDLTAEAVERHVRAIFEAWNSNDVDKIVELDGSGGIGFGYRSREARTFSGDEARAATRAFFSSIVYFRIAVDEINTAVEGNIGLAWGYYTEEFQVRGRAPERVRARFSRTLRRDARGWHSLLYHRDAQPFDEKGRYIPVPRQ